VLAQGHQSPNPAMVPQSPCNWLTVSAAGTPSPAETPKAGSPSRSPGTLNYGWRATITGARAAWTTCVLTDPNDILAKPPRPWLPTTTSWAVSDSSSR
jgi:hypothetical protein